MHFTYVVRASGEAMDKLLMASSFKQSCRQYFKSRDYGSIGGLSIIMDSFDSEIGLSPSTSKLRKVRNAKLRDDDGRLFDIERFYRCGIGISYSRLVIANSAEDVRRIIIDTWKEKLPEVINNKKLLDLDKFLGDLEHISL